MQARRARALVVTAALTIGQPWVASAAELTVLCSNGFQAVMEELIPKFEQATKHKVLATYGVSADLKRRVDAGFKRVLLASSSITYAKEGATGVFFVELVRRLGLEGALQPKMRPASSGDDVGAAVVRGDAELGVLPVSEIVSVSGLAVLGSFPADVQGFMTMVGVLRIRVPTRKI